MSYENLEKLDDLRQKGVLSEAEFQAEKAKILARGTGSADAPGDDLFWGMSENAFAMMLHLAAFLNLVVPFAGLVLQIVMWATTKHQSEAIDQHGKNALNWFISFFIYCVVSAFLCLIIIGIPLLLALLVCQVVFTIMAAIKANNGTVWRYPMAIGFL